MPQDPTPNTQYRKPNLVYRIVHRIARIAYRLYGRWQIVDYHKFPKTGPVIAAANHVSYVDPPFLGAAITRECRFMARHDLWKRKFMRWLLPRVGAFPVHRDTADRTAIRFALDALRQGLVLVLFPEGGRSEDGKLQPAQPGVALIVQKSGAPVVPIALIGPEKMWPVGQKKLKRVPLKIAFGDPLFFTPDSPREEITGAIMRAIAALLTAHGRPSEAKESLAAGRAENSLT